MTYNEYDIVSVKYYGTPIVGMVKKVYSDGIYYRVVDSNNIEYDVDRFHVKAATEEEKKQFRAELKQKQEPVFDEPSEATQRECYDSHYNALGIQPIEIMQIALTPEEFLGFLKGNIIKYTIRAGHKEGEPVEKDLVKAERYREWYDIAKNGGTINPRE